LSDDLYRQRCKRVEILTNLHGMSADQIARRLDCSVETVYRIRRNLGIIDKSKTPLTEGEKQMIVEYLRHGMTMAATAGLISRHPITVRRWAERNLKITTTVEVVRLDQ